MSTKGKEVDGSRGVEPDLVDIEKGEVRGPGDKETAPLASHLKCHKRPRDKSSWFYAVVPTRRHVA